MGKNRIAAGVLPLCVKTGRICLVQRAGNQSHPGVWASFGGSLDEGETVKETAHREFREETLHFGPYKLSTNPLHKSQEGDLTYYTFLGIFKEEFIPDIEGAGEGVDFGWYHLTELPKNIITGMDELMEKRMKFLNLIIAFYQKK